MAGDISRKNGSLGGRPQTEATRIGVQLRKKMAKWMNKNWPRYIKAIEDSALGHEMVIFTDKGVKRIIDVKPNPEMLKYLSDQIVGKPKEVIEHQGGISLLIDE